jgi:ABC-type antimicrobial peptide transport system permease subunit
MRMVFGAPRRSILNLIVGEGLRMSGAGIGVGLIAAAMVTRVMTSMLVGVSPTDSTTFIAIVVLFMAITVAASWLPARRASRLDPMNALREE